MIILHHQLVSEAEKHINLFKKEQASKLTLNFIFDPLQTEGNASHFEVHGALLLNS